MSTIVVTGGAGFIGSHIVDALVARGDRVRVLDSLVTGSMSNLERQRSKVEITVGDIRDADVVAGVLEGADGVIHQAALASVPLSVEKPLLVHDACATGTLNLLNESRKAGIRRVVYAGSSSCYGDRPFSANRETDCAMTLSPYAVSKLAGEHYCHAFFHSFGLETVCVRYFNVFGPRQDPSSHYSAVIPLFITWMLAGKSPTVFGDGQQSRDFCYVENVVQANLLALDGPASICGKSYNVANGRSVTLLELIHTLEELLDLQITPDFQPPRPGDIRDSMADITSAVRELGYSPAIDFRTGLERSIEYYRGLVKAMTP